MDEMNQDRRQAIQHLKTNERIKGVFSTQSVQKIGTGATVRRTIHKSYWMTSELPDGSVQVQPLNRNYIPSGPIRNVEREEFLLKFNPEPEFYVTTVFPRIRELEHTVEKGEEHRENGEHYSAEFEFGTALGIDEENVRANFGLGLTYLERGDTTKANDIFKRLVKLEASFLPEHKHLFNDFGINLRKNRMFEQALDYYNRALELTQDDENLMLNIARAQYEQGDVQSCAESVHKALTINPNHNEGRQFLDFLKKKGYVSENGAAANFAGNDPNE